MIVHLIDGTYELFRHFYGARRFNKGQDKPSGAVLGVLNTVLQMIEEGQEELNRIKARVETLERELLALRGKTRP